MHKNPMWLTFLIVIGLVVLWFVGSAFWKTYTYGRLDAHVPAKKIEWSVAKLSEDFFALQAHYDFEVSNHAFSGETVFKDDLYRNTYAAEQVIPIYAKEEKEVWYDRKNPQYSSLQKKFPLKECISAAFLTGLFIYFVWLGFYVGRFRT